jgi:hypothetical protein
VADDRVPPSHVGLEIRFEWRGRMCHELHLWQVSTRPSGKGWKIDQPVLSPQRWTESGGSAGRSPVEVESDDFIWTRGYALRSEARATVGMAQPECREHRLRLVYRPHGGDPRPLRREDFGVVGRLYCHGPDDSSLARGRLVRRVKDIRASTGRCGDTH